MPIKQRISPCLWFDGQAEDAANFYVSIFKDARITAVSRYGEVGPGPNGSVMAIGFELDGQACHDQARHRGSAADLRGKGRIVWSRASTQGVTAMIDILI